MGAGSFRTEEKLLNSPFSSSGLSYKQDLADHVVGSPDAWSHAIWVSPCYLAELWLSASFLSEKHGSHRAEDI